MGRRREPPVVDERRRQLDRELTRIRWAIHCTRNRRALLVADLDVIDRRLAKLNRQLVDALDRCGDELDVDGDAATDASTEVRRG